MRNSYSKLIFLFFFVMSSLLLFCCSSVRAQSVTISADRQDYCDKISLNIKSELVRSSTREPDQDMALSNKKSHFSNEVRQLQIHKCSNTGGLIHDETIVDRYYDKWDNDYKSDYRILKADLRKLNDTSCLNNPTDFDTLVNSFKDHFKTLKQDMNSDMASIRDFYQSTIVPDVSRVKCVSSS